MKACLKVGLIFKLIIFENTETEATRISRPKFVDSLQGRSELCCDELLSLVEIRLKGCSSSPILRSRR